MTELQEMYLPRLLSELRKLEELKLRCVNTLQRIEKTKEMMQKTYKKLMEGESIN